ncbi:MAG: hypothetical protein Fur0046_26080 [Cyanobacteria bacterium J069]|nr:MAG: hypothetical protein D6742_08655 [Cyanobacteria bacterium J069]
MTLDQQLQDLVQNAPQDGTTPAAVAAIAPALKEIAQQLRHLQYYILQTLEQQWVMTTLNHRTQSEAQKNVVYAFANLKDATTNPLAKDPQIAAFPVPVTHILFQMVAMTGVDSIIFFEVPGNLNAGTEVTRANLQALIQLFLQQSRGGSPLPPDLA